MRYLIAADLHGSAYWTRRLTEEFERSGADRLVLLGDLLYHGPRNDLPEEYAPKLVIPMLNGLRDRVIAVRGNCDTEVDQMVLSFPVLSDSAYISDHGQRIFASHGHIWHPEKLPPLCDGDIFLYGHTHIPDDSLRETENGRIRCINPGSVSIPKEGSPHRCLLWDGGEFTEVLL